MKNARKHERNIKRLLSRAKAGTERPPEPRSPMEQLLLGVFQADASRKQAEEALEAVKTDYVDFNELRVCQPKEIVESVGKSHPHARRKADMITRVLHGVFLRTHTIDLAYMAEMPKRDLRRHLLELGLDRYASAYLALTAFDGHAVCVDDTLVGCLEMDGRIEPGSDLADVQGFLKRVVAQKDARATHELLRAYVERRAGALARKRKAEDDRRKAREAAEAKAAEAKARKKAAAEKAKAAAKRPKKARKPKKASKAKPRARKAARKRAKKPAAKAARPASKPAARKASKRPAAGKRTRKKA